MKRLTKDKSILMARERAFRHFEEMKKWEKENTLIRFILRGFKCSKMPRA